MQIDRADQKNSHINAKMANPLRRQHNGEGFESYEEMAQRAIVEFIDTLDYLLRSDIKYRDWEDMAKPWAVERSIMELTVNPTTRPEELKIFLPLDSIALRTERIFYEILNLIPPNARKSRKALFSLLLKNEETRLAVYNDNSYGQGLAFLVVWMGILWPPAKAEMDKLKLGTMHPFLNYRSLQSWLLEKNIYLIAGLCVCILTYLKTLDIDTRGEMS